MGGTSSRLSIVIWTEMTFENSSRLALRDGVISILTYFDWLGRMRADG